MSKQIPDWENLEILVADIQKQLAPEAEVRHNHYVVGRSGRRRKLDITITQKVGTLPVFIVFDCKAHSRPVKMKDVEAFSVQRDDVNANLGVMVSSSGFDAGAIAIARDKNIILQVFRLAGETDWNNLVGEKAWCFLTKVELPEVKAKAVLKGEPASFNISLEVPLVDDKRELITTLNNAFWEMWKQIGQPIGEFSGLINFEGLPWFIKHGSELIPILSITFSGRTIAKKYLVNLNIGSGNIIEDVNNEKPVYQSIASKGFDWAEIINNQPGIEIDQEEYNEMQTEAKITTDLSNAKPYIRVVFEDKNVKK